MKRINIVIMTMNVVSGAWQSPFACVERYTANSAMFSTTRTAHKRNSKSVAIAKL